MISQTLLEVENHELATVDLLPELQVESKVNAIVESFKNSTLVRLMLFVNYINTNARSNGFISALNTNTRILIQLENDRYVAKRIPAIYIDLLPLGRKVECIIDNVSLPAVFYSTPNYPNYTTQPFSDYLDPNYESIAGFFASCTPLEGFLSSTLNCLHDTGCLQLLLKYFPSLNRKHFNLTNYVLSSKQRNLSVHDHLKTLFIDDWSVKINYSEYFEQCAPSFCSFETTDQKNVYYTLTILISLYGGFTIVLRFLTPCFISMVFKFKSRSQNANETSMMRLRKYGRSLKQLNWFKVAADRTANGVQKQQINTRVYIILLAVMHQVCYSDVVDDRWILLWKERRALFKLHDWRAQASSQLQLLSDLCQLANQTIGDAISRFLLQSFAVSNVLTNADFDAQSNKTLNQFFQSTTTSLRTLVNTTRLFIQVDQPYMGWVMYTPILPDSDLIVDLWKNETNNKESLKITFNLTGTHDIKSRLVDCICATNPLCQSSARLYDMRRFLALSSNSFDIYILTELVERCSAIDSLLFSTLECFYLDFDCFMLLLYAAHDAQGLGMKPSTMYMRPLVYNATMSRFPPHSSIKTIVEKLMIEQWNPILSYKKFYQSCAPRYCTYSQRIRTKSAVEVMIVLLSMIGGLTGSLRIITPYLVKVIFYLWSIITKNRQRTEPEPEQQVRQPCCARLRMIIENLVTFVVTKLINLNIFSARDFGSRVDRITAKRLGQWSTRFYIVIMLTGFALLTVYTIIQPQSMMKVFNQPSFNLSNHLREKYGDQLKCSCSSIASIHSDFVTIEPRFHQICSSPFASDQWRVNITSGLVANLSAYARTDYRRFLSAHLQFLHGLCQISTELVNSFIDQFYTSLFITTELLSNTSFHQQLNSTIEQSRSNAPATFAHLLLLIRRTNHGNAIISTYGTNYEYIVPWDELKNVYAPTQAIIYDNCSCGLHSNCTSQANFIQTNSSERISIKGLKVGCTPSESFLASTLECFFEKSCVKLIENYTFYANNGHSPDPLSTTMSRFSLNTTVAELIANLFVEEWLTMMDYSAYFEQCKPLFCSYKYIERFNTFYILTLLLTLQGGLDIVLKWISPKIVQIIAKVYRYRKQRRNIVQPTSPCEMMPAAETISTIARDSASNLESIPRNEALETNLTLSARCSFKLIVICILLVFVITSLILFSIYFPRKAHATTSTIISTTTDITSTTITKITCDLKFRTIYTETDDIQPTASVIADFNGDHKLDLAFYSVRNHNLHVLLGNGNGTFEEKVKFSIGNIDLIEILTADFNNDNQVDLACANYRQGKIDVLLGYGNGNFQAPKTFSIPQILTPVRITVADFNNDNITDILIAHIENVYVFLGRGDGTFSWLLLTSFSYMRYCPTSIDTADLNHDGYADIIVSIECHGGIAVILGRDNLTVGKMMFSITGSWVINDIVIGDFNGDTRLDMATSSGHSNDTRVMFGYGNGYFHLSKTFTIERFMNPFKLAAGDFNCDDHLDIAFSQSDPFRIGVLVGLGGNGNFDTQTVLSRELISNYIWIDVGDFNSDGYPDIIAVDRSSGTISILLNSCECCIHGNL